MASSKGHNVSRVALGGMFLGALGLQLTHREFFAKLVPPYLERYQDEVAVGTRVLLGVAGVSFLVPTLRGVARWSSLAILVSSLPEAVNQVRQPERMQAAGTPPQVAAGRVLMQGLVIAWVWRTTKRPN